MHFCEGKSELFPLGENVFMVGLPYTACLIICPNYSKF
jgi:hypothetical protein